MLKNEPIASKSDNELTIELESAADSIFGGEPIAEQIEASEPATNELTVDDATEPVLSEIPDEPKLEVDAAAEVTPVADVVNEPEEYKTPEGLNTRSKERFEKLVTIAKEKDDVINQKDEVIKGVRSMLDNTGLSNSELGSWLDVGSLLRTDPQAALDALHTIATNLAKSIGVTPLGVSPLDGFDDLQERVDLGSMKEEDAVLVANARRKEGVQKQVLSRQQSEQERVSVTQAKMESAAKDVETYLMQMQKDLDYEKITPHLIESAKFASEHLDPTKWMAYIRNEYQKIKKLTSASGRGSSKNEPIVDVNSHNAGIKSPSNLDELADNIFG